MHPEPPMLATMHTRPSWHNRAGRVDRSACFTLTVSQLWRRVHEDAWTYQYKSQPPKTGTVPLLKGAAPLHPVARRRHGQPDRTATLTLTARDLWLLHTRQPPHPLQGDRRTTKSNAMRGAFNGRPGPTFADNHQPARTSARPPDTPSHPYASEKPIEKPMGTVPLKKGTVPISSINPNRGVGFSIGLKMLGLDCLWQTTLTVCRIIQHAHLKQHFLVCPVCAASQTKTDLAATPRVAGPAGCQPTASIKQSITPKRPGLATKLYLPLCTPQERNDARLAQLWIDTHTHPNRPLPPQAIQLIERYGELFETKQGRQLRCRQCLGLRYGEVKGKEK